MPTLMTSMSLRTQMLAGARFFVSALLPTGVGNWLGWASGYMGMFYARTLFAGLLSTAEKHYVDYYLPPLLNELRTLVSQTQGDFSGFVTKAVAEVEAVLDQSRTFQHAMLMPLLSAHITPLWGLWRFLNFQQKVFSLCVMAEKAIADKLPMLIEQHLSGVERLFVKHRLEIDENSKFTFTFDPILLLDWNALRKYSHPAHDVRKLVEATKAMQGLIPNVFVIADRLKKFLHGINDYGTLTITPRATWYRGGAGR